MWLHLRAIERNGFIFDIFDIFDIFWQKLTYYFFVISVMLSSWYLWPEASLSSGVCRPWSGRADPLEQKALRCLYQPLAWLISVRAFFTVACEGCFKVFSHTTTRISKLAIWNRYCARLFWVAPKKRFLYFLDVTMYVTMCPDLSARLVLWSVLAHPFSFP